MTISSALNAALSGLQTSTLRAGVTANNVANAATPGYARRAVTLSETVAGGQTTGVAASAIARSENARLTAQRRELTSDVAQVGLLADAWRTLSARIGDTAEGDGLFRRAADFETTLTRAATTPESLASLQAAVRSATAITDELRSLSALASDLRANADADIARGVSVVNGALHDIETLNRRIAGVDRTTNGAAVLFDERQRVLDTIATYIPIRSIDRDSGAIDVMTTEGVFLLAGKARTLSFSPGAAFGAGQTLGSGALSGLTVDGVDLTPGAASFGALSGGKLGAAFQLRDVDVPMVTGQLDAFAADLMQRLGADALDPTTPPGAPGLFVDPLPASGAGLAGRLQLNAAVDPAQGGGIWRLRDGLAATTEGPPGNDTLLENLRAALLAVRPVSAGAITGNFSVTGLVGHIATSAGQTRIHFESVLASVNTQHGALVSAETAATGVDIDTEMQTLLSIEQAYAANARVIEVASQMLNRLMEI
jgi:flagellar hook-associated protein 1